VNNVKHRRDSHFGLRLFEAPCQSKAVIDGFHGGGGFSFRNLSFCRFPLAGQGEIFMLIAVCVEYAVGAYIISKLIYAATMLLYLLNIRPQTD